MTTCSLSYVLTTYNKLPYLRLVLTRLVANRRPDEEIVVCDGGSSDGTPEYLRELFETGQIQQFVSERDKGEAHGFNKAILMARGELIKPITDDDAFCYPAIREAAKFMQANPAVDVLTGNCGLIKLEQLEIASLYTDVADNFQRWLNQQEVVWMIGLPLLIRRTSLALTGLFHTGVVQVDTEFTYRLTSLKGVSLAWSTAVLSTRLENPQSNFRVMNQGRAADASTQESDRMRYYYDLRIGNSFKDFVRYKSGWLERVKKPLRPVRRMLFNLLKRPHFQGNATMPTSYVPDSGAHSDEDRLSIAFTVADQFMQEYNMAHPTKFLFKAQSITKVLN